MKLKEIVDLLDAELICGDEFLDMEIRMGCGSDLLSDVLAFTKSEALLLTGLRNTQVIRTVEMIDISAVCFVRGKRPEDEAVELAKEKGIPLMRTELPMFESCGRLHAKGLEGCSECGEGG